MCVEYDDAVIEISVSYIDFIRLWIDLRIGRTAKTCNVIAVALLSGFADLEHKFPSLRELQMLSIIVPVAADSDEVRCIDGDAMFILRPVIALAGAAPVLDQIAFAIELHDRRRWAAAFGGRRIKGQRLL